MFIFELTEQDSLQIQKACRASAGKLFSGEKSARMRIPCNILSLPKASGTSPVTLAGNLVVANAEMLSGITLLQLVHPGLSVLYGGIPVILDPKTGIPGHGAPENALMSAGLALLGQFYGLPSLVRTNSD